MEYKCSYILLTAPKETVIRILNAAICNSGAGKVIVAGDDIDTINQKIKNAAGEEICIEIPHLLDENALKDDAIRKKEHEKAEDLPTYERPISIDKVEDRGEEFAIDLSLVEDEIWDYFDWLDWLDIVRLYGCRIVIDVVYNDCDPEFIGTYIYELENGKVKETSIQPTLDLNEYNNTFKELIETDSQRYRSFKLLDLKSKVKQMQYEILLEETHLMKAQLLDNDGTVIVPEDVTEIMDSAFEGCKELKSIIVSSSVKKIGRYAFKGCENLSNIVLPQSVEEILDRAFDGCPCEAEMKDRYTEILNYTHHTFTEEDDKWIEEILG